MYCALIVKDEVLFRALSILYLHSETARRKKFPSSRNVARLLYIYSLRMTESCEHSSLQAPLPRDSDALQASLTAEEAAGKAVAPVAVDADNATVTEDENVSADGVVAEGDETMNGAKDTMREEILRVGTEKMRLVGIRSVSIDDICRQLGISKKTFYVYFESKDQLVEEGIHLHEQMIERQFLEEVRGKSVIQILHEWATIASNSEKGAEQPPPIMYDLHKYYPELCKSHKERLNVMMADYMEQFIEQGKKEDVFREGLDAHLTAHLIARTHHQLMEMLRLNPDKREKLLQYASQGVDIMIRGMLTPQGMKALQDWQS